MMVLPGCVCVCACERERDRGRERVSKMLFDVRYSWSSMMLHMCVLIMGIYGSASSMWISVNDASQCPHQKLHLYLLKTLVIINGITQAHFCYTTHTLYYLHIRCVLIIFVWTIIEGREQIWKLSKGRGNTCWKIRWDGGGQNVQTYISGGGMKRYSYLPSSHLGWSGWGERIAYATVV